MNTDTSAGGPGIIAFFAFVFLIVALWLLMRNMNARLRRMSYRARQEEAERERALSQGAAPTSTDAPGSRQAPGSTDVPTGGSADEPTEPQDRSE